MTQQLPSLAGTVDLDPEWHSMVNMARAFMRDYAKLNLLLAEQETDDKTLLMCLQLAVVDVNATPPGTSFSLAGLVSKAYVNILLRGTLIHVLEGLMILSARNFLNWQEGGQLVGLQDRNPVLFNMVKYFKDDYTYQLKQKKIADSIMSCMDEGQIGVHSEYFAVNGHLWS